MSLFIESICYQYGDFHNLEGHQERVFKAFTDHLPNYKPLTLSEILSQPKDLDSKVKVRIVYGAEGYEISETLYSPKQLSSLQLVPALIDYDYKFADRSQLDFLHSIRGDADDILILKDFHLTDSHYANVALLQNGKWYTPSTYLLNGVKRQALLASGVLIEKTITIDDLAQYECVSLINAMLDPGEVVVPITNIIY
jgi:4-amino-4-deoxychorismate lyase